jgi:ElaB/YqjD/DUF883 family membrane-anchored ribosome-binding protein
MNDQSQISARHDPFETQANSAMMNGVKESASDAAGVVKRTLSGARESIEDSYHIAREAVAGAQVAVVDKGAAAAKAAGRYVREYPWAAVGAAAVIGVVLGMLVRRR